MPQVLRVHREKQDLRVHKVCQVTLDQQVLPEPLDRKVLKACKVTLVLRDQLELLVQLDLRVRRVPLAQQVPQVRKVLPVL